MNIFYLAESPVVAARVQHDRHVVKMILESAQMLSTAIHIGRDAETFSPPHQIAEAYDIVAKSFPDSTIYKPTHANHPSTQWARSNNYAFAWLACHLLELSDEYTRRFNRTHKCQRLAYLFGAVASRLHNRCGFLVKSSDATTVYMSLSNGKMHTFKTRLTPDILQAAEWHRAPPYCGPDSYLNTDPSDGRIRCIESYRQYYLNEKVAGNRWTQHSTLCLPDWLRPHATIHVPPQPERRKRLFAPVPYKSPVPIPANMRLGRIKL